MYLGALDLKIPQAGLDWHGEVDEENSQQPIVLILPGFFYLLFNSALNFWWWLDVKLNFTSLSMYTCCFLNEHFLVGLTGSSQSEYVKTFVTVAKEEVNFSCGWVKILECNFQVGARCCVFNYRGRGGVSLASPRTYCASDPSDLGEVSGNKMYVWECREFEDVKLQNKTGDLK